MTASPITIPVAVVSGDTASQWADKVRTSLLANTNVSAFFTIGGTGTAVILTAINPADNDGTMSLVVSAGSAADASLPLTSANTQAGVSGVTNMWCASFDIELLKRYVQILVGVTEPPGSGFRFGAYLSTVVR